MKSKHLENKKHMKKTAFAILMVSSLIFVGCSESQFPEDTEALKKASKYDDPMKAYSHLTTSQKKWDEDRSDKELQSYDEARYKYLIKAANRMNSDALTELYGKPDLNVFESSSSNEMESARAALAVKVLNTAESSNDPKLLSLAGELAGKGDYSVKDTIKAVGFYARAWSLGDANSAGKASLLFSEINDKHNAYLWSLRCTVNCYRDQNNDLADFERVLSPEAINQIQQVAKDKTLVELDTKSR